MTGIDLFVVVMAINVILIVCFIAGIVVLFLQTTAQDVPMGRIVNNTDREAIEHAISLIGLAERSMEIFDDGDGIEESVYDNEDFVDKVADKVEKGQLRVLCFFNDRDEVKDRLFIKKMASLENKKYISVWTRKEGSKRASIHYKSVDGEKITHLSRHDKGSSDRDYQIVDLRNSLMRLRLSFRAMFWVHYKQYKRSFEKLNLETINA